MSIDEGLRAYVRKLDASFQELQSQLAQTIDAVRRINSNQAYVSFKEKTIREALKATPGWYTNEVAIAATQRTPITINTDSRGWFFAEKVVMSWRPTAGANANTWTGLSGDNPFISGSRQVAGAAVADTVNFYWEYAEGSSQLSRMNRAVPGGMLYRQDLDGLIPGSDGWPPATSVSTFITMLANPTNAGIFNVTYIGIQCYNSVT